jgi:hypothetical protein
MNGPRAAVPALLLAVSVVAGAAVVPVPVTASDHVAVVDGTASPDEVSPGDTVNNQQVHVVVDNVSADGDTDRYYVEFPNDLADGLSPNSAEANDTAITSSIQVVDGYDDDGVDDTLTFATSASGGGSIPLNLTIDTGVDYPDKEDRHEIDFRAVDSSNGQATESGVVSIQAGSPPTISDYAVTNPTDRDVAVSFNASEELTDITVDVTDGSGSTVTTLTESDFSGTNRSGTWVYDATHTAAQDGKYTATLTEASDGTFDGADGQSGTVRVNTVDVAIEDGTADPANVTPGTTVDNQQVTVTLSGVSADGDTDTHYVEFPDALAGGLAVNSASVNGSASIAQSAELVDGFDGDGTADTVRFQTDTDAGGTVALNVTVDVSVDYPDADGTYGIDARTEDSDGDTDERTGVTAIEAGSGGDGTDDTSDGTDDTSDGTSDGTDDTSDGTDDTSDGTSDTGGNTTDSSGPAPTVERFNLTTTDREVNLTVAVDSPVDRLIVDLDGSVEGALTRSDFTRGERNGTDVYRATVATDTPGTFGAELEAAANETGDGAANQTDSITVPLREGSGPTGAATPPWVGNGSSAHTFTMPVGTDSALVDRELRTVAVDYGPMFGATDGSVGSVSDDGNVAVLRVLAADGTEKARLGGTDAVSVNVVDSEVRLDLSDVDSSRRPTLAAGDRVAVRFEPVTNPGVAGDYAADITLAGPNGTTDGATDSVHVRDPSATAALDTEFVWLENSSIAADLSATTPVERATVNSTTPAIGPVRVVVPDDPPPATADAPGAVIAVKNVSRPPLATGATVELRATLDADTVDENGSSIVLIRYDGTTDDWQRLGTEVVDRDDGTVTVAATSPGTSMLALATTADGTDEPAQATPTPDPDDGTQTTTAEGGVLGIGAALIAGLLLAVAAVVGRRL